MALASVVKKLGRMIRKTLYLCVGVVAAALMSINACSSNVQANTNESELERIAHERELEAQREQKSVWETDLADESRFTLNLKLNKQEKALARKFARTITHNLQRNDVYVHYLLTKFKEHDVPLELAAIPLLESGLNAKVHHGGAHGAWQYVRSTGKSLGLHKTQNYDGIYDFFASTEAGIKYLQRLYRDLGDWELVAVAYNQGEYGVKKALQRAAKAGVKNPNAENIRLSRSTKAYLMRFKAYSDVLKNPELYGVRLPKIKNRPAFRRVDIAGRLNSLNEAARLSGARIEVIRKLNSGYTGDKIDSHHGLYMPVEHAEVLEKAISDKDSVASNTQVTDTPLVVIKY